ncbi:MAG TPA: ribokinase [Steroidobacteraceae bacterium]|nr:ribokinase [Steroidobacteraceae bacterium]
MKQPRDAILVAGSANLDFVVRADHVPAPGETVLGRELAIVPGGKGANQAVACARAGGVATRMLLALGEDAFAPLMEKSLRDAGVTLHIVRAQAASGVALICLADNAENAITVAPGANAMLRGSDLPALDGVGYLLLQLETPLETVGAFARTARENGIKVLLNAAPACALPASLLASVDVLIVNEDELAKVAGRHGAVTEVLAGIDVPCAVVTLGARGCCATERGTFHLQPAFKVEPVDTTAAGDTFCGALAAALCSGSPLPQALRRASAAAALATTRVGAQSSIPAAAEVDSLLRSHADGRPGAADELARYCGVR